MAPPWSKKREVPCWCVPQGQPPFAPFLHPFCPHLPHHLSMCPHIAPFLPGACPEGRQHLASFLPPFCPVRINLQFSAQSKSHIIYTLHSKPLNRDTQNALTFKQ